MQEDLSALVN